MKPRVSRLMAAMLGAALISPALCARSQDPQSTPVDVQAQNLSVAEVAADHLRVNMRLLVRARESARITSLSFAHCSLNGAPIFLSAWDQPIDLPADEFVQLPGELTVAVYYRDMDSPAPLEKLLSEGSVTLDGEATLTIRLNLAQKFAVMSKTATTVVPLHKTVPVDIPGGELSRKAGLMTLDAARPLFGTVHKVAADAGIPRQDPWQDENRRKYRDDVLYVVSHYQLQARNGVKTDYTYTGTGFRISPAHFVLMREAIEPWNFNPACVARMRSEGARLVEGTADIELYVAGDVLDRDQRGLSLRRGDFRLVSKGKEQRERVMVPSKRGLRKTSLEVRGTRDNLAVFAFTSPASLQASPEFAHDSDALDPMTVVRFQMPKPGQPLEVESITMRAHRKGDQLELDDPVDARTFGSPAIVSSGILAVIQDEHSAALLPDSLRRAGYGLSN